MDATFLKTQIETTEAQIIALQTAINNYIATGLTQSYTLDTGQSRQVVTRATITEAQNMLNGLYNRLSMLGVRKDGSGSTRVQPKW